MELDYSSLKTQPLLKLFNSVLHRKGAKDSMQLIKCG